MAFPTVVSTATTPASSGTTLAITMPSSISVGNLLVAIVSADNDSAATMSGWTKPTNGWGSNGTNGDTVWLRVATGSDSGTHTNNSQTRFAHCYCIDNWSGTLSDVKVATASSSTVNPPSLAMGSAQDYLWLAVARNGATINTAPTNYTNLVTVNFITSYLGSARRQLNASTEDPGAFNGSASSAHALTIGIPPSPGQNGAATLSAGSTLSVAGTAVGSGTAALSASSTLAVAGTGVGAGAVSLPATAALSAAASAVRPAAATLAADSALSVPAVRVTSAAVALSASGALTSTGVLPGPGVALSAGATLSVSGSAVRAGAAAALPGGATLTVDTTSDLNAFMDLAAGASLSAGSVKVQQAALNLTADADLLAGTASVRLGAAVLSAHSALLADAFIPTAKPVVFRDMACTVTPPTGHFEPYPLTLGGDWRTNDLRLLLVSGTGAASKASLDMPMSPDPPTGFTGAYILDQGNQTHGVYHRRLQAGDTATNVAWPKPPGWRHFMWATLTARGVDPAVAPLAGKLTTSYHSNDSAAVVSPVAVPAPGAMLLFLGTMPDPSGLWPSWPSALGVPTGWTPLVSTDKSGGTFYPYDPNPSLIVVGKSYAAAGSTGTVSVPVGSGSPAFFGMWCFLRPVPDVSITVGAA